MTRPDAAPLPPPNRPRARLLLQTTVVMLAVTACCLFAGLLAHRFPLFIDVTSTRAHRLSTRTLSTLAKLKGPTELVVTVNSAAIDARAAERTRDVLDTFDRASDRLSVTIVDVASPDGLSRLDDVWKRVVDRYAGDIDKQRAALRSAGAAAAELGSQLDRFGAELAELDKSIPEGDRTIAALKRFISDSASFCRLAAKDIADGIARSGELASASIGRSPVPSFDAAALALRRTLPAISAQVSQLAQSIDSATAAKDEQIAPAIRDRLKPLAKDLGGVRDRLARVESAIGALPRLPVVNVARVLERSSAALVIGPPATDRGSRDLAGVDIDSLFPARISDDHSLPRIDLRARTEELVASAIASLVNPAPPILVLLHGQNARLAPDFTPFSSVFERLRLRGFDVVEWAVALDKEQPPLAKLNPAGDRPVVYALLYTPPDTPEDAARFVNLTRTVEQLASDGRALLVSISPSSMPALGQPDTIAAFLEPIGLKADSGRPLLHRVGTPANPVVTPDTLVTSGSDNGEFPIRTALNDLRTRLPWAVPLRIADKAPAAVTPIITIPDDDQTWAESQWTEFRSVPAAQRPYIRVQDQPREDSQRDDGNGPWVVAAAVERKLAGKPDTQRLVVVGASGWFMDDIAESALLVDNKRIAVNPGNTELLEAAIYWLAGQEQLIGASPQAHAAAVIPPLEPGTIAAIRWALIAGLPVLILLLGAVWRLLRG